MSELTNRIDTILTTRRMSRSQLARESGIPESTIRNWNTRSTPKISDVKAIAEALNVSIDYLVYGSKEKNEFIIASDERELIEAYRHLDLRDRNSVFTLCKSLESQYCVKEKSESISG